MRKIKQAEGFDTDADGRTFTVRSIEREARADDPFAESPAWFDGEGFCAACQSFGCGCCDA